MDGVLREDTGSIYAASLFAGLVIKCAPDGGVSVAEVPGPTGLDFARGVVYAGSLDVGGGPGAVLAISPSAFHPAG